MNTISYQEFKKVISYAYLRKFDNEWDGLDRWNKIKGNYSEEVIGEWNPVVFSANYTEFREYLLKHFPEFSEDGKMNEANHFIIQCIRIPFKNKLSARRLYQIAYNIGQLKTSLHEYPGALIDEFLEMQLHSMDTYCEM